MALNFPDTPSNGQVYLGENGIQYTYNLTNDSWTGKLQSSNVPIDPSPADVSVTPAFGNPSGTNPGSGTLADPFIITNSIVPTLGGSTESLQTITITNGKAGDQVIFTNNTTPTTIAPKYAQAVGVIDGNGKWTGKLTYNDSLGAETTANITYTGNLQVGNTTVYFRWVVQQQATPPMIVTVGSALTGQALIGTELGATQPTVTGGILPYTYSYRWQTSDNGADFTGILNATSNVYTLVVSDIGKYIRCAATVSDSSTIQIVSITSNTAIVNAMSIDVSLSTTTPKAGDTITATAVTAGGVAPVTTAYQWKADDVNIAGATSTTYTVIEADKDKRLSCLVTTTDTSGTSVSKSSDPTDPVFSGTAPEINTVTLTEVTPDSPDRYTDQSFTVAVDMTSDNPKSDYALRGKVLGDLSVDVSTSVITGVSVSSGVVPSGFNAVIYTGNATSTGLTTKVTTGFAPDLMWIKGRTLAYNHQLYDTLRGQNSGLQSNGTAAAEDMGSIASFDADGFTVNPIAGAGDDTDYVAWCWDAGDTTVTNNDGATQSTVRSNGYFSVVQASIGALTTIGHGLTATPDLVIAKCSSTTSPWFIQLPGVMATGTNLAFTANAEVSDNFWSSPQTATTLKINSNTSVGGTSDWIFYCWAAETGKSSFGLYTGNGGSNTIACGFEPAFVMIKSTSNNEQWEIVDNARNTSNPRNSVLYPNLAAAEVTGSTFDIDFTSTGFTLNNADGGMNYSGYTYIYAAFAGPSDGTTLQLTDNTGLASLNAQDAVVQNSGGTPVTSAITNVANANYASTVVAEVGFNSNRGPDKGFDGNTQATGSPTYCQSSTSNRYVQWNASTYGINTSTSLVRVWAISSGDDISCTGSTGTITIDATDNVNGNVVPDVGNLTSIRVNNPGGLGGFSGISVDGVLLIDGTTTLTLTDDTNLANFRVGDALGGAGGMFATTLYTGTGSTQTITNGIDLIGKGGLTWVKNRDVSWGHRLFDTERGDYNFLDSSSNLQENDSDTTLSFGATGFTVGADSAVNASGNDIVAWTFQKEAKFFDVQTYVGNNTAGPIPHNLTSVPGCIITKAYSAEADWHVYHQSLGTGKFLTLNSASVSTTNADSFPTAPTDAVFYPGQSENATGYNYIAYLFADEPGVIKCGSMTSDGATTETIDCGFSPQWLMYKRTTGNSDWLILDTKRESGDGALAANNNEAESNYPFVTFGQTGFTMNWASIGGIGDYIYIAIAGSNGTVTNVNAAANQMTLDGGSWSGTNGTGDPDGWNQSQVWSTNLSGALYPAGNASAPAAAFDGNLATGCKTSNQSTPVVYNASLTNVTSLSLQVRGSGFNTTNTTFVISGNGIQTLSTTIGTSLVPLTVTNSTVSDISVTSTAGSTSAGIAGIVVNGKLLVDTGISGTPPTPATFVTGLTFPAASGSVSSVDTTANTLTVAGSSGRWLVTESDYNTALKLNKFVLAPDSVQQVTSLFTVMDNSGNISDLSVEDPGYTTMIGDPTYTTTFPSVFPSGETPDVELPPGTKYQVEVKATNTLGNDNAFSNEVMPVAGLLQSSVITASEVVLDGWNLVASRSNTWSGVTYGDGKFVAVADNVSGSLVMLSTDDGLTWSSASAASGSTYWSSVTYGNGTYVAVASGGSNRAMYSTNGTSWSNPSTAPFANSWKSVAYGNGRFVAVAADQATKQAMYSTNGTSWTLASTPAQRSGVSISSWNSVVYGADKFVAVAETGDRVMYSTNGTTWTVVPGIEGNWKSITYGNGKFVAVAYSGTNAVMYSTDGISWTAVQGPAGLYWKSVTYGNGRFVAIPSGSASEGNTMWSDDGITWTVDSVSTNGWNAITYGGSTGNERFLTVASNGTDRVMWSTTGTNGGTTITTADNTNYNLFSAGDAVVESSGGTPVTSAITNVNTTATTTGPFAGARTYDGYAGATYNNATPYVISSGDTFNGTSSNVFLFDRGQLGSTYSLTFTKTGGSENFQTYDSDSPSTTFSEVVNNDPGPVIIDQNNTAFKQYVLIYATGSGSITWELTGTASVGTLLTFTNDTNIANFRVGDQLNGGSGFNPVIYTGTGTTQSITTGFSPDLVWVKCRTAANGHQLYDAIRGPTEVLVSNTTGAEVTEAFGLTSFNADGFSVESDSSVNGVGGGFVAWCWDAGNTTVTNNDGSVASQVRSNGNFSIVSFASSNASAVTVGHGLNSAPKFYTCKSLTSGNWYTYVPVADPASGWMALNTSAILNTATSWGAAATDTVFSFPTDFSWAEGDPVIAYCWAETPGISSFGSYTGDGSATGPVIDCGFEPAFVMIKSSTIADTWWTVFDTARDPANPNNVQLYPNDSQEETVYDPRQIDITSTGFTIKGADSFINTSGATYIYAAFASNSTITNINEAANQMTVDTGSFTTGNSITGPTFPAATGTISAVDSTNSKLTFSETTGRWLVTQSDYDTAKKLNTKVAIPLVLDQGNAAHVALFNAINTSLTAYPTDKQTFVDALRTKVSGLSLTTPELQVLCTASHTLIKRFVVTVAAYSGSNYFYIDGVRQATLALKKGTTYIFDQDEETNTGHPLKIYTDANKTTEYTSGVTIVGTPGSALSRTAFLVPTNAPATLYYQCSNHAGMGGQLNIS